MARIFLSWRRLIVCMKKLLLLSAVLLGTVVASQAGVHVDIGIGFLFPYSERIIISAPPPVCAPPPVYVEPRYCVPAPRVVYVPPPVVYVPQRYYYYSRPTYYSGRSDWNHEHGQSGWNSHGNSHRR